MQEEEFWDACNNISEMTDPVSTPEKREWRKKVKNSVGLRGLSCYRTGNSLKKFSNNIITLKCTRVTQVSKETNTQRS